MEGEQASADGGTPCEGVRGAPGSTNPQGFALQAVARAWSRTQWLLAADGRSGLDDGHEPCSLDPESGENGARNVFDVAHAIDPVQHAGSLVMLSNRARLCVVGGQPGPNRGLGIVGPSHLNETAAWASG